MPFDKDEFISGAEAWDNRELGSDEKYVQVASQEDLDALNKALGKSTDGESQ